MPKSQTWSDGLEIRDLTPDEYDMLLIPWHREIFAGGSPRFVPDSGYSDVEKQTTNALGKSFAAGQYKMRVGAFLNSEFVGWHYGRQTNAETYDMTNSAVLPKFRNKKIYSRLLEFATNRAVEDGFQRLTSNHHPSNNAVLIAKLKAGFWICGMDLNDMFGTTLNMVWYKNQLRRDMFAVRSGYMYPSQEIVETVLTKK